MKDSYWAVSEVNKSTSEIFAECESLFKVWTSYDKKRLDSNFPIPKVLTTRYFAKNIEADEQYQNKSAKTLEKEGGEFITLRERLLLELLYFKETGKHLDIENWTLCAGSRCADGDVPGVGWDDRKLHVYWYYGQYAHSYLRARAAVSLETSDSNPLSLEARVQKLEEFVQSLSEALSKPMP